MSTKETLPTMSVDKSISKQALECADELFEPNRLLCATDVIEKHMATLITSLRTRLDAAEKELADADLLLGLEWRQAIKAVNGDPVAAKGLIIAQLVGDLAEAKEANAELVKDRERLEGVERLANFDLVKNCKCS